MQTRQAELSALLTKQHVTNHLPVKEPPTFSGNVFDYPAFITAFDSIICDTVLRIVHFWDFLIRCQGTVKTVGSLNELDSIQTLTKISAKLPSYSGTK